MSDLTLQLQSFQFDLSELCLGLGLPQSDRHQFVLQFIHGVLLRGLFPVTATTTCAAAAGHVMLQKNGVNRWNSLVIKWMRHVDTHTRIVARQTATVCVCYLPALVELCNCVLHFSE